MLLFCLTMKIYLSPKLLLYLPIDVPVHDPYLFMFILSFWLTAKIYLSMFLLYYMSTAVPVPQYTCSAYFFLFGIKCTVTFQLICWGMYRQIYPKINLPVYLHASPLTNKQRPTCHHNYLCICPYMYLFIFIHSFRLTHQRFYCCTHLQMYLFISIPVQFISSFLA